jgi:ubiquinone/menaquinone biosynthesis C-methylase UbiE
VDLKPLLGVFGSSAGYVVGGIVAVLLGLVALAVVQGREVSFWPPRIGPRSTDPVGLVPRPAARRAQAGRASAASADRAAVSPLAVAAGSARPAAFDREFDVQAARVFYEEIAPNYDERNSGNLLATHMETITRINQVRANKPALRVLDLGGGTGKNIATHFFEEASIHWTYVDFCPAMVEQFKHHLRGRPLYKNVSLHVEDLTHVHRRLAPASYDVVLLSLVLSSMPQLPDFGTIAGLLAPDGVLIVSDINPPYSQANPHYAALAGEARGETVALRTNAVDLLDLLTRAKAAGLGLADIARIGEDDISYSFIAVFALARAEPHADPHRRDGEVLSS